jgi:putative membrane protein
LSSSVCALSFFPSPVLQRLPNVSAGFLDLGRQLENPFGYDSSDLDLDHYCALLASELQEIAAHPSPSPAAFVWSPLNTPFQPYDKRSAPDILAEYSVANSGSGAEQAAMRGVPGMRKYLQKVHHDFEENTKRAYEARKKAHKRKGSASWDSDPHEVEVCLV